MIVANAAFFFGAVLLLGSSYVHFHLWQSVGYRHIPTIGSLFLLQSVVGLIIAVLVVVVRRVWAGIVGAGFTLSTLAGFLMSVKFGLFGFKDSSMAPYAHEAFALESGAFLLLSIAVLVCSSDA